MKKLILTFLTGLTFIFSKNTYSQTAASDSLLGNRSLQASAFNPKSAPPAFTSDPPGAYINSKALKNFKKSFKAVTNENWISGPEGFVAAFNLDGIRHYVNYNKKGHWRHTIMNYDEKKLPKNIRAMVKPVYYDYNITWVQEIHVVGVDYPIYLITVHDGTHWKILKVANGEMEVFKEFRKT